MIVLGVDTAIRKTGYGVIDLQPGGSFKILDCGIIRNGPSLPHSECLRRLSGGIRELVSSFHPDAASLETAFVSRNIRTAMILSLARGSVITALAEMGVPAFEYSPKTAKRAATGNGEADKAQVASVLAAWGGLDIKGIPNDATDALALALCHASLAVRPDGACRIPKPI